MVYSVTNNFWKRWKINRGNFSQGHETHILSGGVVTWTEHSRNPKGSSSPVAASLGHSGGWCTTLPRTSPSGTNSAPEQICITFDRCKECTSGTRGRACSSCRHWPRGFARTQRSGVSSCRAQDTRVGGRVGWRPESEGARGYKREHR